MGLTLQDVAKVMGVTPRTVRRWEKGETHITDEEQWLQLSELLRCSVTWLMDLPEINDGEAA